MLRCYSFRNLRVKGNIRGARILFILYKGGFGLNVDAALYIVSLYLETFTYSNIACLLQSILEPIFDCRIAPIKGPESSHILLGHIFVFS